MRVPRGIVRWGLALLGAASVSAREVVDMAGRRVVVPGAPVRVLSLCTSVTATLAALGATARLAAVDEYGRIVAGAAEKPVVARAGPPSVERALALGVDLAFVWWYQDDAAAALERVGIPVLRIRAGRAAEVPAMIRLVGAALDLPAPAAAAARRVEDFLAQAPAADGTGPRVYLELYGRGRTAGTGTLLGDLLERAGARNAAGELAGHAALPPERLAAEPPDVIVFIAGFGDAAEIAARPGLADSPAVRDRRIFAADRARLIGGPDLPETVRYLHELIHGHALPQDHP